jgi:hypothetical protein
MREHHSVEQLRDVAANKNGMFNDKAAKMHA